VVKLTATFQSNLIEKMGKFGEHHKIDL
jgi:hypothetical protein